VGLRLFWQLAVDFNNSNVDEYATGTHHHQYVDSDVHTLSYDIIHPNHHFHPPNHLLLASSDYKQCTIE
jgi:hypothetical protein